MKSDQQEEGIPNVRDSPLNSPAKEEEKKKQQDGGVASQEEAKDQQSSQDMFPEDESDERQTEGRRSPPVYACWEMEDGSLYAPNLGICWPETPTSATKRRHWRRRAPRSREDEHLEEEQEADVAPDYAVEEQIDGRLYAPNLNVYWPQQPPPSFTRQEASSPFATSDRGTSRRDQSVRVSRWRHFNFGGRIDIAAAADGSDDEEELTRNWRTELPAANCRSRSGRCGRRRRRRQRRQQTECTREVDEDDSPSSPRPRPFRFVLHVSTQDLCVSGFWAGSRPAWDKGGPSLAQFRNEFSCYKGLCSRAEIVQELKHRPAEYLLYHEAPWAESVDDRRPTLSSGRLPLTLCYQSSALAAYRHLRITKSGQTILLDNEKFTSKLRFCSLKYLVKSGAIYVHLHRNASPDLFLPCTAHCPCRRRTRLTNTGHIH